MVKASPALLRSFSARQIRSLGIPAEIKQGEGRVGMTPSGITSVLKIRPDMSVSVLSGAGIGSGFSDAQYEQAGAFITGDPNTVWSCDMVVKVKEPMDGSQHGKPDEFDMLNAYQPLLFTYLHLAADRDLASRTAKTGATTIAYETTQKEDGSIPMLIPMSIIAGMQAPMVASSLGYPHGAMGRLMYGFSQAAEPQKVLILGGGVVGSYAAAVALGLNAKVRILDLNPAAPMNHLANIAENRDYRFSSMNIGEHLAFKKATVKNIEHGLHWANTVICAALIPGAPAPKLVNDDFFRNTEPGKVIVDVAVDQGGNSTQTHPTTHAKPTYIVDNELGHHEYGDISTPGTVLYSVANMPGMNPWTATRALTSATLPYILAMAKGFGHAFEQFPELLGGINTHAGVITKKEVAVPLGLTSMFSELSDF